MRHLERNDVLCIAGTAVLAGIAGEVFAIWPVAAAGLAAVVGIVRGVPVIRWLTRYAAWAVPPTLAVLLVTIDIVGVTASPGPARYLVTAAVAAACLTLRHRWPGPRADQAIVLCASALFVYGAVGVLIGRLVYGVEDGALPIILPLIILMAGAVRPVLDRRGVVGAVRILSGLGTLYALLSIAARASHSPLPLDVFNHEKAFIVALAITAGIAGRSRILTIAAAAAAVAVFIAYPAATYVVAALGCIATVVLAKLRWHGFRRIAAGLIIIVGTLWAVLNVDSLIDLTRPYFALVGKTDNGATRQVLYGQAIARIERNPIFSDYFAGSITVAGKLNGRDSTVLPVHNDYLSVALGGGLLGGVLLILVLLLVNGLAFRAVNAALRASPERRAMIALLCAVNAAALSAFANPVFMNPGSSTTVFGLCAGLVSLAAAVLRPSRRGDVGENGTAVRRSRVP